jgi:NADH-ubiquinone oxidoreductase chain 5
MYLSLISIPLLVSAAAGLIGRKTGYKGAVLITCSGVIFTSLLSVIAYYEVALSESEASVTIGKWLNCELLFINWGFLFDSLTLTMLIPVLTVSSLVHLYSSGYMKADPHQPRFFSYLSLFTFFMIMLVAGDNMVVLFIGWEGVGICSYLLISFWFTRNSATKSALQAVVVNRVGDWSIYLAMFTLFWLTGCLDYFSLFSLSHELHQPLVFYLVLLLLIGAMGKSAQLGLHVWLPNAMEGPTPVSALIHAATMVTAGVYLLMRCSPILEFSDTALVCIAWVGAATAIFGATIGIVQHDLKRVIAYSTCSQLGYLLLACGLSQYQAALFHLVNHAFFKALLFLCAGAVIHSFHDEQDIRRYGGLREMIPLTYSLMMVGSLSLMAIPLLSGYWSKELILHSAVGYFTLSAYQAYLLATLSAVFTGLYTSRSISLTFYGTPNGLLKSYYSSHEPSVSMGIALLILAGLSIGFGYMANEVMVSSGISLFGASLFTLPHHLSSVGSISEFLLPFGSMVSPLMLTLGGVFLYFTSSLILLHSTPVAFVMTRAKISKVVGFIAHLLSFRYRFDHLYHHMITRRALNCAMIAALALDQGVLEMIGPFGISTILLKGSRMIASFDTGFIPHYALYVIIGLLLLFTAVLLMLLSTPLGTVGKVPLSIGVGEVAFAHLLLVFLYVLISSSALSGSGSNDLLDAERSES